MWEHVLYSYSIQYSRADGTLATGIHVRNRCWIRWTTGYRVKNNAARCDRSVITAGVVTGRGRGGNGRHSYSFSIKRVRTVEARAKTDCEKRVVSYRLVYWFLHVRMRRVYIFAEITWARTRLRLSNFTVSFTKPELYQRQICCVRGFDLTPAVIVYVKIARCITSGVHV